MCNALVRVILGTAVLLSATSAQDTRPQFDVASIKPNHSGNPIMQFQPGPEGNFTASNCSLRLLIRYAYDMQPFQLVGGPGWVTSDRYDIAAKAAGNPPLPGLQAMLQRLLEDRFQLKYHSETREADGYALVVSKPGKLRESEPGDCPPPSSGPHPPCGGLRNSPGNTFGYKLTSADLAGSLAFFLRRFVVDRTGLTGKYDVELEWMPDPDPSSALPPDVDRPSVATDRPSIFTALQEQLGLKLEATKGPLRVLVIDHIERPTEN